MLRTTCEQWTKITNSSYGSEKPTRKAARGNIIINLRAVIPNNHVFLPFLRLILNRCINVEGDPESKSARGAPWNDCQHPSATTWFLQDLALVKNGKIASLPAEFRLAPSCHPIRWTNTAWKGHDASGRLGDFEGRLPRECRTFLYKAWRLVCLSMSWMGQEQPP